MIYRIAPLMWMLQRKKKCKWECNSLFGLASAWSSNSGNVPLGSPSTATAATQSFTGLRHHAKDAQATPPYASLDMSFLCKNTKILDK